MFCSLRSIVRRVGSVGCAVNTGSISIESSSACKPSMSIPDAFSLSSVSSSPPGWFWSASRQVLAPPANAMHFLGRVDHLEVGREAANELQREISVEAFDERRKILARLLVVLAPANRAQAGGLDELVRAPRRSVRE